MLCGIATWREARVERFGERGFYLRQVAADERTDIAQALLEPIVGPTLLRSLAQGIECGLDVY